MFLLYSSFPPIESTNVKDDLNNGINRQDMMEGGNSMGPHPQTENYKQLILLREREFMISRFLYLVIQFQPASPQVRHIYIHTNIIYVYATLNILGSILYLNTYAIIHICSNNYRNNYRKKATDQRGVREHMEGLER